MTHRPSTLRLDTVQAPAASTGKHRPMTRALLAGAMMAAVLLTSGCATMGLNTVSSTVSSFGEWPAGRAITTYAFERLPSQEARAQAHAAVEATAVAAIERNGFKAAPAATADVLIQVSARSVRTEADWDRAFWPRLSVWGGRSVYWGLSTPFPSSRTYEHEVAVMLRDRATGKTLYESRAASNGYSGTDATLLSAMFRAALSDFPRPAISPRRVDIDTSVPANAMPTAGPTPAQQQVVR